MDYDLIVIGSGWAGFNAALRARVLGLKVGLIEKNQIGGTCLNRGCIPTKTLIQSAKVYNLLKKAKQFGVETGEVRANFSEIQQRKEKIIQELSRGMEFLLKGIEFIHGEAEFITPQMIKAGPRELRAKNFLIATGSSPYELNTLKFDGNKIISSDEALNLKDVPGKLLIVGGGVIGCEFATLFNALGAKVSLVEKMPQLLPAEDREVAKKLEICFKKKGIQVSLGQDVLALNLGDYDLALVCVGRTANIAGLGLEDLGLTIEKGKILVDDYLRTSLCHIFAAGDCTGRLMLAHFAAYQGGIAAENIACPQGLKKADNPNVPNCIFSDPEIASVGLNEESAKAKSIDIEVKKFDFLGSAMARIIAENEGFIKLVIDKQTDCLIGASLIGPRVTELIGILTLAVSQGVKKSQLKSTIFAHPTLSEAISEALN